MTSTECRGRPSLPELLRQVINEQELSQAEAARLSHCDPATISKVINGKLIPTPPVMRGMDKGLGTGTALADAAAIARAADGTHRRRVPQQMPAGPHPLLHRDTDLHHLVTALTTDPIVILSGPTGVGKTAVARTLADRAADSYPRGILHANLSSHHPGRAADTATILHRWLIALGACDEQIPTGAGNRIDMLTNALSARRGRVLLTLEDAADEDHVRALLPETRECTVLVTSTRRLPGLALHEGASQHSLAPLDTQEAVDLLAHRLGETTPHDTDALHDVITYCDGLPLAIAAAAELVTIHGLPNAAAQLENTPLAALDSAIGPAGTGLQETYQAAWTRLSHPARQLLATLANGDTQRWDANAAGELRREHLIDTDAHLGVLLRDWLQRRDPHDSAPNAGRTSAA